MTIAIALAAVQEAVATDYPDRSIELIAQVHRIQVRGLGIEPQRHPRAKGMCSKRSPRLLALWHAPQILERSKTSSVLGLAHRNTQGLLLRAVDKKSGILS